MFQFSDPQAFYLLVFLPVLLAVYFAMGWVQRKRMQRWGNAQMMRQLTRGYSPWRPLVKVSLLLCALALVIFMLARPQWGVQTVEDESKGIEVAIMVDVSNSMYAQDIKPSRMERTRLLLSTLIDKMKNDRISLGVFAGEAYPQLPITNDYVSAKMFVDNLEPGIVSCQGTNFAAAIDLAANSFTDNEQVGKAILIISDGEDHEENAEEAAEAAAKKGIHVYVLGIGTTAGAPIPLPRGGVMQDETGQAVHTALNEETCKRIAQAGNGAYFHVDETNHAQELLLGSWRKLKQAPTSASYEAADEQFQAIALIVLILLLAEFFLRETQPSSTLWQRLRRW